ncbi:MAG TPA: cupin domain-containing protein [Candidatus Kapabacteria bacterium]|nr:cupin domain-containing protein [Candidatus Kapabacteria bacterium]
MEPLNLHEAFAGIDALWSPRLAAQVNDVAVKLARVQGEFLWHHHEAEDELFLVVKGTLRLEFRDRVVMLNEGEMLLVPRGVEHRPVAEEEAWLMLVEPSTTLNAGNVRNERTIDRVAGV